MSILILPCDLYPMSSRSAKVHSSMDVTASEMRSCGNRSGSPAAGSRSGARHGRSHRRRGHEAAAGRRARVSCSRSAVTWLLYTCASPITCTKSPRLSPVTCASRQVSSAYLQGGGVERRRRGAGCVERGARRSRRRRRRRRRRDGGDGAGARTRRC